MFFGVLFFVFVFLSLDPLRMYISRPQIFQSFGSNREVQKGEEICSGGTARDWGDLKLGSDSSVELMLCSDGLETRVCVHEDFPVTQIISKEAIPDPLQLCSLVLKSPATYHISGGNIIWFVLVQSLSQSPQVLQKKQAPHYGVWPPRCKDYQRVRQSDCLKFQPYQIHFYFGFLFCF